MTHPVSSIVIMQQHTRSAQPPCGYFLRRELPGGLAAVRTSGPTVTNSLQYCNWVPGFEAAQVSHPFRFQRPQSAQIFAAWCNERQVPPHLLWQTGPARPFQMAWRPGLSKESWWRLCAQYISAVVPSAAIVGQQCNGSAVQVTGQHGCSVPSEAIDSASAIAARGPRVRQTYNCETLTCHVRLITAQT